MKRKPIKVVWKPLPTEYGWAYLNERRIILDAGMNDQMILRTIPHEFAHIYFPNEPEYKIKAFGIDVGKALYGEGFRRNHEDDE